MTRGGSRPGAGRPRTGRADSKQIRVSAKAAAQLDKIAEKRRTSVRAVVDRLVSIALAAGLWEEVR